MTTLKKRILIGILRMSIFVVLMVLTISNVIDPSPLLSELIADSIPARLWLIASLVTTLIFSFWLYMENIDDIGKSRLLFTLAWGLGIYVVVAIVIIASELQLKYCSLLSGPILVLFIFLFDWGRLSRLKSDKKEADKINGARDIIWKLDFPILIGVCITTFVCFIMPETLSTFNEGFVSGATAMQVIVGNTVFELSS